MKILFVCGANVARSQMAETFFNKICKLRKKSHKAKSAGATPGKYEGEFVKDVSINTVQSMREFGYDISRKKVKKLDKKMVKDADKVVVLGVRINLPDYVKEKEIIFWNIKDPKNEGMEVFREVRDEIEEEVGKLITAI